METMRFKTFFRLRSQAAFTLIEIIIVLAIIAVLAAVILVGIDPIDKINSANDSKVQSDINAIAKALEAYSVNNYNSYPNPATPEDWVQPTLVASGELKAVINPPAGYFCNAAQTINKYMFNNVAGTEGQVVCRLKSKKFTAEPWWKWCSTSGKADSLTGVGLCPI